MNINVDLLSVVMGSKVNDYFIDDNWVGFQYEDDSNECLIRTINIYELAHKCKEWATSQGFIILTYGEAYYNVDVHYHSNKSKFGNLAFSDTAQEEPEAIFKGCEWIIHNL